MGFPPIHLPPARRGFARGGMPWLRRKLRVDQQQRCPFCGCDMVKLSVGDVPDDDLRVEGYCENSGCAVREFTILALRVGEPLDRADVEALRVVDAAAMTGQDAVPSPMELRNAPLALRRRVRVTVEPLE